MPRAPARTDARIVAVTGSAGKTGTKEMLRACLSRAGSTHAAEKSYNNHWGVPLTLARMPAATRFAVFEIGMNHAGEITPLSRNGAPARGRHHHRGARASRSLRQSRPIAEAKAEIFAGLVPGGTAVLHARQSALPAARGTRRRARRPDRQSFGYVRRLRHPRHIQVDARARGTAVIAGSVAARLPYRVGAPGEHYVKNSLAVLAVLDVLGAAA